MSKLVIDLEEFPSVDLKVGESVTLQVRGIVVRHETPVADVSGYGGKDFAPTGAEIELLISEVWA